MTTTRTAKTAAVRGRDASLPKPVARKAGWSDVDIRAVDTVRVLAADAVQKVGNGHPGTAMSLAPAAYLLYQQVMRHDPADPHWLDGQLTRIAADLARTPRFVYASRDKGFDPEPPEQPPSAASAVGTP